MRFSLLFLAIAGVLVSSLALLRHYSIEEQPTPPASYWDSSAVNHSPFSVVYGVPVAAIGIAGYALLGTLAFFRRRELTAVCSLLGLAYTLHLTNIEAHILGLWCMYCVVSLILITLVVFMAFAELLALREHPSEL
jgi:uncharacterized membrane protein